MKKTIIILLILSICVALFACNRTENDESRDKPKDESSAFVDDSSNVIDESAEPIVVENVPASQLMSMDKNSIVAYAESLIAMINRNTTEIPDDFFYPASDDDLPSPDNPYFSDILSSMNYCMETVEEYGIYRCSDVVYTNAKIAAMKEGPVKNISSITRMPITTMRASFLQICHKYIIGSFSKKQKTV